jgi:hypothetical protein
VAEEGENNGGNESNQTGYNIGTYENVTMMPPV